MQSICGEDTTTIQRKIDWTFEVGQGHKTDMVDRLLECTQVKGVHILDERESPRNPYHFCASKLY